VVPVTAPRALLPEELYRRALTVGRRAAGTAGPNPPVGCVIVRDGVVVGEGSTSAVGGPHAEVVALDAAGDAAHDAIAVVTLEPCAHVGRTPPCTEALLAAGIAEVHVLLRDPDPVAAGGLEVLEARGVRTVDVGGLHRPLADVAVHDLRGFLARVRHGRPHVTLKLAQTPDGGTVPPPGGYLTAPEARTRVHVLRRESDAVLVGSGTVAADDPLLDVRLVGADAGRQPRPVILASSADVASDARAVRRGTVVLVGPDAPSERCAQLVAAGAEVVAVARDLAGDGLDIRAAFAALLDLRILTVLAEPGPRLARAMLAADVVDVIELHVAGGAEATRPLRPALPGLAALVAEDAPGVDRIVTADGDVVLRTDLSQEPAHQFGEVA
jgi:diaminohydroxyphosphoribosylaminopyrimidine deaminase / 5-amino-6-(5-phosphoribosylamino)uracil reductase